MTKDEYINKIKDKLTDKDWTAIARARKRKESIHLYKPDAKEGYDYQECPITGRRMASITGRYIKTIPTTEEEYFKYFPELKEVPEGRKEVDRLAKQKLYVDENGNHIINESTGKPMTVIEVNIMKKMETMKQVGEDGLTGIQRAGMKTRETHLNNVDEYGMNGYQQKVYNDFLAGKGIKSEKKKTLFQNYVELVNYVTYKSDHRDSIVGGATLTITRDSSDRNNELQIDHIFSKFDGYDFAQSPFMIAHPNNCWVITIQENIQKNKSSIRTLDEVYTSTGYNRERSEYEYILYTEAVEASYAAGDAYSNLFVMRYMIDNYKLPQYKNDFVEYVKSIIHSDGKRYT